MQVTNTTSEVNATNETLLAYSLRCLIVARHKSVNMSLQHLSQDDKERLARYLDCLIEMDLDQRRRAKSDVLYTAQ